MPIDEGVAVVAETAADAQRGLRALVVEWDDTNAERRSSAELLVEHVRLVDVDNALAAAAFTIDAVYSLVPAIGTWTALAVIVARFPSASAARRSAPGQRGERSPGRSARSSPG